MKSSVVRKYHRLSLSKKFTTRALAILGTLILLIAALTIYGSQTGNFVVSVKNINRNESIALSIEEDKSNEVSRLIASPLKDCIDGCYDDIPEDIDEGLGSKNDKSGRYLAMSFYLINNGMTTRNVAMDFRITQVTKRIDTILRVMIIQDGEKTFFSKARENVDNGDGLGEPIWGFDYDRRYVITNANAFDDEYIVHKKINDFEKGSSIKFTIVMWLDGLDDQNPDGNRDMLGGALKTELNFSIIG